MPEHLGLDMVRPMMSFNPNVSGWSLAKNALRGWKRGSGVEATTRRLMTAGQRGRTVLCAARKVWGHPFRKAFTTPDGRWLQWREKKANRR